MNDPSNPPFGSATYANDRVSSDVEDWGCLSRQLSEQTLETKNQKLKRLPIDGANQTIRRSIVFSDAQPVKITAKIEYIGENSTITRMSVRNSKLDGDSRFPRIEEMPHFHYDSVDFSSPLRMCLFETSKKNDQPTGKMTPESEEENSIKVKVSCRDKSWVVTRNLGDFVGLDEQFHKCVYNRNFTGLESLKFLQSECAISPNLKQRLKIYIERLSEIAGNTVWCGPILNWFEVDNKGNHLLLTEDSAINVPAVAAARVIKRYTAQSSDEISFESEEQQLANRILEFYQCYMVGDIVSVIDMPPFEESTWWRGKHDFEVGFFPSQCVQVIGQSKAAVSSNKLTPVASKRGKVVSFLRTFLSSRPSRIKLLQSGILRERTFGCDLGEHLQRSGRDVPLVVEMCTQLIETNGITNGVYRLSGMTTNVQKIRMLFDSEESPDLEQDCFLHDIHCVGSVLKMYFRELPNPLLTSHLYEKFTNAVRIKDGFDREIAVHHAVQQLPPFHYKTVEFLLKHLAKLADCDKETGMHAKNLSIVWAPNLLRQEKMDVSSTLEHLSSQAVVIEFLIRNVDIFFDKNTAARAITKFPSSPKFGRQRSYSDPAASDSISEYDRSKIRPSSVGISPLPKLISLEQAMTSKNLSNVAHNLQSKPSRSNNKVPLAEPESSPDLSSPENDPCRSGSPASSTGTLKPGKNYIDVGEGPSSLSEYHTVIDLPGRKKLTNTNRSNRKWKSLFGKRPASLKSGSFKRPPARQHSFESSSKADSCEKVHLRSRSVDELSKANPVSEEEAEREKRLHISNPVCRNKFSRQITGSKCSRSKFYVDTELPPEGTRGTFIKSDDKLGNVSARTTIRSEGGKDVNVSTSQGERPSQPPPRPATLPTGYEHSASRQSSSKIKNSPRRPNGDESTFFVAGRVNPQTNSKTVEIIRAPNIQSLKTGRPVSNEESAITTEGRVPLPSKQ